jgi:hypothetical protein
MIAFEKEPCCLKLLRDVIVVLRVREVAKGCNCCTKGT